MSKACPSVRVASGSNAAVICMNRSMVFVWIYALCRRRTLGNGRRLKVENEEKRPSRNSKRVSYTPRF